MPRSTRNRKGSRKTRKSHRKHRGGRRQMLDMSGGQMPDIMSGGRRQMLPLSGGQMPDIMSGGQLELNDNSMNVASRASLTNGQNFLAAHRAQHGGMAPVGDTGVLDESLRSFARVGPLDQALQQIQGMSDQAGGRRRRKASRKSRKASRKSRKGSRKSRKGSRKASRKGRKASRKSRKQRGGFAPADAPGNLLPPDLEAVAVSGQNPETKLAADPTFLAPKA
jgi:hypothetical protein